MFLWECYYEIYLLKYEFIVQMHLFYTHTTCFDFRFDFRPRRSVRHITMLTG